MPPINPNAQRIVDACNGAYPANQNDCNQFLKAACTTLGVALPAGANANMLVDHLSNAANGWTKLADGAHAAAKQAADIGTFVVVGLKGGEHADRRTHGHVGVIIAGPADAHGYPVGAWGSIAPGLARNGASIREAWRVVDVEHVHYFTRAI